MGKPPRTCHSMVSSAPDAASAALVSGYLDSANENELWPEVEYEEAASASHVQGAICSKCAYRKPAWREDASELLALDARADAMMLEAMSLGGSSLRSTLRSESARLQLRTPPAYLSPRVAKRSRDEE